MYGQLLFVGFLLFYEINAQTNVDCPIMDMSSSASSSYSITEDCNLADRILITKDYTINGNGNTIYAKAGKRHFKIDAANDPGSNAATVKWVVKIHNVTLEGGLPREWVGLPTGYATENEGGSIYLKHVSKMKPQDNYITLQLHDITFRHNRARLDGSVIFVENGGVLDIRNAIFEDNLIEKEVENNEQYSGSVIEYKSFAGDHEQVFLNVQFKDNKVCNGTVSDAACATKATEVFVWLEGEGNPADTERIDLGFYNTNINKLEVYANQAITTNYKLRQINSVIGTHTENTHVAGHDDQYASCTTSGSKSICPGSPNVYSQTYNTHTACAPRSGQGVFCYPECNSTAGSGTENDFTKFDFNNPCRTCTIYEYAHEGICKKDTISTCTTAGEGLVATSNLLQSDSECKACPIGRYAASSDDICLECGDGYTTFDDTPSVVSISATQCIECNNATEYDHDGEAHTACVTTTGRCGPGFEVLITPSHEPNYCILCSRGKYQVKENTTDACISWATTIENCTASSGFYMEGTRIKDAECHFNENPDTVFYRFDPSDFSFSVDDVFCFPDTFQMMNPVDGKVSCASCNPTTFLNSYKANTMELSKSLRKGGCCYNPHHHLCGVLMNAYKSACGGRGKSSKGEVKKCDQ